MQQKARGTLFGVSANGFQELLCARSRVVGRERERETERKKRRGEEREGEKEH